MVETEALYLEDSNEMLADGYSLLHNQQETRQKVSIEVESAGRKVEASLTNLRDLIEEYGREPDHYEAKITSIFDLIAKIQVYIRSLQSVEDIYSEEWRGFKHRLQRYCRRLDLLQVHRKHILRAALWWMIEQGDQHDLEAIRKLAIEHPNLPKDICLLIEQAEDRIGEREDDPFYIAKMGEEALKRNLPLWAQKYKNRYIAIHHHTVVAAAANRAELWDLLGRNEKTRNQRFYIAHMTNVVDK